MRKRDKGALGRIEKMEISALVVSSVSGVSLSCGRRF
jgi:hypothetical protein